MFVSDRTGPDVTDLSLSLWVHGVHAVKTGLRSRKHVWNTDWRLGHFGWRGFINIEPVVVERFERFCLSQSESWSWKKKKERKKKHLCKSGKSAAFVPRCCSFVVIWWTSPCRWRHGPSHELHRRPWVVFVPSSSSSSYRPLQEEIRSGRVCSCFQREHFLFPQSQTKADQKLLSYWNEECVWVCVWAVDTMWLTVITVQQVYIYRSWWVCGGQHHPGQDTKPWFCEWHFTHRWLSCWFFRSTLRILQHEVKLLLW